MTEKNKVKFGLSNVHIYPIKSDDSQGTVYDDGFALPGAVNLSLKAEGSMDPFFADNVPYYVTSANNGYSGSLEVAMLNDDFNTKIIGLKQDATSGLLVESVDDMVHEFAMAFQFEGDVHATRHIFYRCKASRPNIDGETKSDKVAPKTDSFEFTAIARVSDGKIKAKAEAGSTAYDTFFAKPAEIGEAGSTGTNS